MKRAWTLSTPLIASLVALFLLAFIGGARLSATLPTFLTSIPHVVLFVLFALVLTLLITRAIAGARQTARTTLAYDASPTPTLLVDVTTARIINANTRARTLLALPKGNAYPPLADVLDDETARFFTSDAYRERVLKGGAPYVYPFPDALTRRGFVRMTVTPLSVTGTEYALCLIHVKDDARDDEKYAVLERILETLPNPAYLSAPDGTVRVCNRKFEVLTTIPREHLIGARLSDMKERSAFSIYYALDAEVAREERARTMEGTITRADGRRRNITTYKAPVPFFDGTKGHITIIEDTTTHNRIARSVQKAQKLQRALNTTTLPPFKEINLAAFYMPSDEVGGDFFNISVIDKGILVIVHADCTGHGIEAAMDATLMKYIVDRNIANAGRSVWPSILLEQINRDLIRYAEEEKYPAMCCAVIDVPRSIMAYARAGSLVPFVINGGVVRELERPKGTILGYDIESTFENKLYSLRQGDTVVFYSDALTEAVQDNKLVFTEDDLIPVLRTFSKGVNENLSRLVTHLASKGVRTPLSDDLSIIMLEHIASYTRTHTISREDDVPAIIEALQEELALRSYPERCALRVGVALAELVMNGLEHGNAFDPAKHVTVTLSIDCERVTATVEDEGEGFLPHEVPSPANLQRLSTLLAEENAEALSRGYGIWLAKEYTDALEYTWKANKVTMQKKRPPVQTLFHNGERDAHIHAESRRRTTKEDV